MPPVLGPASSSPTRLKSCAGASATTVSPSLMQKTDTSGPSRNSSTTSRPSGLARQARACSTATSRESVTTTPLPAASPSSLTTGGAPSASRAASTSSIVVHTWASAVGTSAQAMTSLAKDLLPSRRAASAEGPKTANPASRHTSATPATRGASGPTTTRSTRCSRATATTAFPSRMSTGTQRAVTSMPGLPGAAITASTPGSAATALTRACSRAPEPSTRTFTAPSLGCAETRQQACPDRGPLVDEDRVHRGVPPGAVGAAHVATSAALEDRPQLEDGRPRPGVDDVGLDLHPPEAARLERVGEEQELALRVDLRVPPARAVHRPAEVHVLASGVDVAERARADDGARRAEVAVGDEPDRVCRPARPVGPAGPHRGRDERLRVGHAPVGRHHRETLLVAARVGVDGEEPRGVGGGRHVEPDEPSDERHASWRHTGLCGHEVTVDLMVPAPPEAPSESLDVSEHFERIVTAEHRAR